MLEVKERHLAMLRDIFSDYCPNAEIWAYGSRVRGNCHEGSDLDLVVRNFHDDTKSINILRTRIGDSDIPFLVDIYMFDRLPPSFQAEILKCYVVIFGETEY